MGECGSIEVGERLYETRRPTFPCGDINAPGMEHGVRVGVRVGEDRVAVRDRMRRVGGVDLR